MLVVKKRVRRSGYDLHHSDFLQHRMLLRFLEIEQERKHRGLKQHREIRPNTERLGHPVVVTIGSIHKYVNKDI